MSDYYSSTGTPASGSAFESAPVRSEFSLISTGFAKLAPLAGNNNLPVFINSAGSAQEALSISSAKAKLGLAIGVDVQAYDANLPAWPSTVDATEVSYLDGVTSAIQTQFADVQTQLSGKEGADSTILKQADVDDTPVNGATTAPVSSNWAYDHVAAADPHPGYMLESNLGTGANNYLQLNASAQLPAVDGSLLTNLPLTRNILIVEDQELSGTDGGSSLAGVNTRVLNTVVYNGITGASLATDQITLPAGTFLIRADAPCYYGNQHQVYLYNVTDGVELKRGTSEYNYYSSIIQTRSHVETVVTFSATTVLELRHYITKPKATNGLGYSSGQGTEVYARMFIDQLA